MYGTVRGRGENASFPVLRRLMGDAAYEFGLTLGASSPRAGRAVSRISEVGNCLDLTIENVTKRFQKSVLFMVRLLAVCFAKIVEVEK